MATDTKQNLAPDSLPASPLVSVIVPAYREAENLPVLIPRVHEALNQAGMSAEIIVVDDSTPDASPQVMEQLAAEHPCRLIVRTDERGLSSAVIRGMHEARGNVLVCMDADLSHPPEKVPELVAAILEQQGDFVIGSRYVAGGKTDDDWGLFRWLNSKVATVLARPLTAAKDPMAGFFALHRDTFHAAQEHNPPRNSSRTCSTSAGCTASVWDGGRNRCCSAWSAPAAWSSTSVYSSCSCT